MRVAVLADVHANLPAMQAVWTDIQGKGVDRVFCLGDLVGYYPWPNQAIDFVRQHEIECIQGNYDESVGGELFACGCDFKDAKAAELGEISLNWTIGQTTGENKAWLRGLPKQLRLKLAGRDLWLVHGSPRRNTEYLTQQFPLTELQQMLADETAGSVLFCGHTHLAYHRKLDELHVINAGSAGKPKHGNPNVTYVLVELDENVTVSIVEVAYDYRQAAADVIRAGLAEEFAQVLLTGQA